MKNAKKAVLAALFLSVLTNLCAALMTKYGGYQLFNEPLGRMGGVEYIGIIIPVIILILPVFHQGLKRIIWNKKDLLFIILILSGNILLLFLSTC